MNNFVLILGALTVAGSVCLTLLALRSAHQANARCANLELSSKDADQLLDDNKIRILHLTRIGKENARLIDRLSTEQSRLAASSGKTGFDEAIALIQHGADAEQLIKTCGISTAEASLVEALYRRSESVIPAAQVRQKHS